MKRLINEILKEKIYSREKYLSKIRPFYSTDIVKVITGIRRCGKTYILKSIIKELCLNRKKSRIIYIPLDKRGFKNINSPEKLELEIEKYIKDNKQYILILDEIQNVEKFEKVILQYQEEGYSIFLTGSNSYLLSDEISTKLTGRYINFEVFPFDFNESIEFKKIFKKPIKKDVYEEFNQYILSGGFPKSYEFKDIEAKQLYTKSIIEEILKKDVYMRKHINNKALFERVQSYLVNNYAATFSLTKFHDALVKEGVKCKYSTVKQFIEDLKKAKIICECNRFDLKSKKSIKREQKYYLADLSIYFYTNVDNSLNYGPSLENLIYIYFRTLGYEISIGKIGKLECDFIIRKPNRDYAYIQVAYSLQGDGVEEREYRPFKYIKYGYPKYIISLDKNRNQKDGIKHINAIDLFLGKEEI